MPANPNGDKPAPIKFDLGSLDYETPPPLHFAFNGKRFVVDNPGDVDWIKIDRIDPGDVGTLLRTYLGEQQYKTLIAIPGFKAKHGGRLIEEIQEHFTGGLDQGEDDASPQSLNGSAPRSRRTSHSAPATN